MKSWLEFLPAQLRGLAVKAISMVWAVAWAMAPMVPGQEAGPEAAAAAKVRALENARFEVQLRGDTRALDAMFDPAVVLVEYNGTLWSKAEYLAQVRRDGRNVLELSTESLTVHAFGDIATAVGIYRERGMKSGQAYMQRRHYIDTWAFKDGAWVCIAAASSPVPR